MMGSPLSSPPDEPQTRAGPGIGAIVAFCLGAAILIVGFVAAALIGRAWWAEAKVYGWSERTATIIEAHALAPTRRDRDPFLSVRFRYDYAGRSYESDRVDGRSSVRDRNADSLAELWKPGSLWPCYVDPGNPQVAVLRRGSLWWGFVMLFPLTLGGALGGLFLYAAWASLRSDAEREAKAATPAGARAKRIVTRVATTLLFVSLALMTYFMGVHPILLFESAKRWQERPCTIVASRVRAYDHDHDHDRQTSYAAVVAFRYQFDGRERASGDYELVEDGNRSYREAADIVARYPPGARTRCYVDPGNPDRATIDRSLAPGTPFALLPFGFLVALTWGVVTSARRRKVA